MVKNGYHEICEILRREILEGRYDDGRKLPSEFGLARRFGVCRPTVSRAMQDLAAAGLVVRRKGAPTVLTRFARNATGTLGLLVQGEYNYRDLFPEICRRLVTRAERGGWKVQRRSVLPCGKYEHKTRLVAIVEELVAAHVTGVFLQPMEAVGDAAKFNRELVSRLDHAGIRTVLLDYDIVSSPKRSTYDLVSVDNFSGGYELGLHLLAIGGRRIAFAGMEYPSESTLGRLRGVSQALIESGVGWRNDQNIVIVEPFDEKVITSFLHAFLPDAVVAYNDGSSRVCGKRS